LIAAIVAVQGVGIDITFLTAGIAALGLGLTLSLQNQISRKILKSIYLEYVIGTNNEIDIFIKYICGDGYKSIYDVSCAIVKSLQKIS